MTDRKEFLQECGSSYLQVMDALGYFRKDVQEQCERVLGKHAPDLCDIIGLNFSDLKRSPYADPDKPSSLAVEGAYLGWQAKRKDGLTLWLYLYWTREPDPGESPLGAQMDILIKDNETANALAAKLQNVCKGPPFADQPCCYAFHREHLTFWIGMRADEFALFHDKLDQLLSFVLPLLRSIADIQSYFVSSMKRVEPSEG